LKPLHVLLFHVLICEMAVLMAARFGARYACRPWLFTHASRRTLCEKLALKSSASALQLCWLRVRCQRQAGDGSL
jgi:hypothetical protein